MSLLERHYAHLRRSDPAAKCKLDKDGEVPVEVRCQHCGRTFQVENTIFGDREKAPATCPACKHPQEVINPRLATLRIDRTRKKVPQVLSQTTPDGRLLLLPQDRDFSLKVLEGEEAGTVYPVNKPRFLIGRTNADAAINDTMVSRLHCALEISAEGVILQDLESTNGTLVNGKPIHSAPLANGSTFKIGSHLFQLVITPRPA
ncbi:MAG: FHA domain-containing protein [Terriglobia bacterium]